jgi:lipopolysaccharide export system protein LptC
MMLRDYQAYLWLILLAVLSAWLVSLADFEEAAQPAATAHRTDYFSSAYSKMEMDAQGKPKSHLRAAKMMHYSDDNITELDAPVMVFFNENQPPWEVRSETAQLSADGKDLYMHGKVVVERAAAPGVLDARDGTGRGGHAGVRARPRRRSPAAPAGGPSPGGPALSDALDRAGGRAAARRGGPSEAAASRRRGGPRARRAGQRGGGRSGVGMLKANSSNLKVKPEISYAETDAWTELISPPHITSGTGMKVTFSKPIHLQLLSKVKGRYEVK